MKLYEAKHPKKKPKIRRAREKNIRKEDPSRDLALVP